MHAKQAYRNRQGGAVYLFVIFAIAVSGVLLAGFGQVWATAARREKEVQLLHVGNAYRQAIASYYAATPGEQKQFPQTLNDLLLDKRFPYVRRHLRHLYPDPMSGQANWGLIREQGRIVGVYSTDMRKPIKQGGFDAREKMPEKAENYQDWKFIGRDLAPGLPGQAI